MVVVVCLEKAINDENTATLNDSLISLIFIFTSHFCTAVEAGRWSPFPGTTESPCRFNIVRKQLYLNTSELSLQNLSVARKYPVQA